MEPLSPVEIIEVPVGEALPVLGGKTTKPVAIGGLVVAIPELEVAATGPVEAIGLVVSPGIEVVLAIDVVIAEVVTGFAVVLVLPDTLPEVM